MSLSGLIPARFLTIIAHLVITIVILWSKDDNIRSCLPSSFTQSQFDDKDLELTIGLSVSLGLFVIELIGFFGGISMFSPTQALISIAAHASASVSLAYFIFEEWECSTFWWIFGFCSCVPALTEVAVLVGVLVLNKGL